jgi:hypothetical protein
MKLTNLLLLMLPLIQLGCAHQKQAAHTPLPPNHVNIILHEFKTAGYTIPESIIDELMQQEIRQKSGNGLSDQP